MVYIASLFKALQCITVTYNRAYLRECIKYMET